MSLLSRVLALPSFLFAVFVFYWSLPIFALTYRIRFANAGKRNDMLDWARALVGFFGVTLLRAGDQTLYRGGPCIYLCNHRSWADFFVDTYLTEGRAALMSRWLVYFVFPVFCTSVRVLRGIVLFKRGNIADKEAFNTWLDGVLLRSPVPGLLVYPEGHRSLKPASLPLKRGMLHYAYGRGTPVQIIVTSHKEEVLSEKTLSVRYGRRLVANFSPVLRPAEYGTFGEFMAAVQAAWDAAWAAAYTTQAQGLPRYSLADAHSYDYPASMRAQQLAITLASVAVFGAVLAASWRGLAAALAAAGPAQQWVALALAAWVGASMLRSVL